MNIEKSISQTKPFKSQQTKVAVNLLFSYMWLRDHQKQFFKAHDITMQQFNILRILRGAKDPISTSAIRERMLDRASDVSRLVDRLAKKDLVNKETRPSDLRKIDVSITKNGLKVLRDIDRKIDKWQNKLINLSESESKQLSDLLDKMRS